MTTEAPAKPETHVFQAEVTELLRLMVHAVYSETEVFLRELISNASDACDKLRYEAIAKPALLETGGELAIRIKADTDAGTLAVSDSGIGMDRQELIDNLGTVARSGTRAFVNRLAEPKPGCGRPPAPRGSTSRPRPRSSRRGCRAAPRSPCT
jgi:molecular chaperone HtpG